MKDAMKDFGKMIQDQKPKSGSDVKCAEIKALPTGTNGFGAEKQKNPFKIGEYNKAKATFEMNSTEDLRRIPETKPKFDFSSETGPCHYFKSTFARLMVGNSNGRNGTSQDGCKSMDHVLANKKVGSRSSLVPKALTTAADRGADGCQAKLRMMPGKENWELRRAQLAEVRDDDFSSEDVPISEASLGNKKSETINNSLNGQAISPDRPGSRSSSFSFNKYLADCNERRFDEARVRTPLSASCRSSFHRSYSSASDVDSVMLQSQVTTLEWQLRQAEASRQMYRAVMEQVVAFLQKTHKNLDLLQNRLDDNDIDDVTRIPRSRSVHAVVDSSTSIKFSSPRSETNLSFQKAKSFGQIGDPDCPKHGNMYREMSWRRPRKQRGSDDLTPSKLSEEAFRLLRTVKSLLSTREPDLTSRLNPVSTTCSSPANIADVSSASSTVSAALESDNSDRFLPREQQQYLGLRGKDSPARHEDSRRRPSREEPEAKGSPPQLSTGSSADDESGFSSLSSFQETAGPVPNSMFHHHKHKVEAIYQEVGLPKVEDFECKIHRRWSSTPVDSHLTKLRPASLCTNGEAIKVLWV